MRVFAGCMVPVLVMLGACAPDIMPQAEDGADIFARNCTACHSSRGEGDRTLANGTVAPDLTRIAFRNGGDFPEAKVLSQIDGYGRGSAGEVMPEFGALLQGDLIPVDIDGTLTPTPRPLAALLVYLERIQAP